MLARPLTAEHQRAFGTAPTLLARAPGRINLIGEHVDYCGLPVFPMAIQRGTTIAARPRSDGVVRITNVDPHFESREFLLGTDIPPRPTGDWGNYVQASAQALVRRYGTLRGVDAVVTSDLPIAAGLSSSSALVVAVAVTLLEANDVPYDPLELMDLLAQGERYVGTAGGGMDQAISLGARAGHATRIDFNPLRLAHTALPRDWRFVVAWSLVRAEKSGAAQRTYNERTRETAEARAIVVRRLGLRPATPYAELLAARPLAVLLEAASALPRPLGARFSHVVSEATRVGDAIAAMGRGDLATFGGLLDASHASLRDDYEVSSPELDQLVAIARAAGATGARLTGAGFGGCVVAVTDRARVAGVVSVLEREYYAARGVTGSRDAFLFIGEPSDGATVQPLPDGRTVGLSDGKA
jgi:galactokinase